MVNNKIKIVSLSNEQFMQIHHRPDRVVIVEKVPVEIKPIYTIVGIISIAGILYSASKLKEERDKVFDKLMEINSLNKINSSNSSEIK